MMTVSELREWLDDLPDDAEVGISEDAMSLEVVGNPREYVEVGALPLEELV